MPQTDSNNKNIAKNTMMLYIRMGISLVVGLFTTRVILEALGVDDYGIYGLVGGIVVFMSFINGAMSSATSRFLTYELGRETGSKLKETFISAFWIHAIIAGIIFILAETIGLWFLYNQLVIPHDRMQAAFWVYQFSILSAVVGITQVPYNASVISHEDMNIFAYAEIINSLLKLGIAYLILICPFDKLISYAFLIFAESFGIAMFYRIFCIRHYSECHIRLIIDKKNAKEMLSFCSWDLYGNLCVVGKDQGLSFLINMFFGVALNASSSIAVTVSGTLSGFTSNITMAIRPQIIKRYAAEKIQSMFSLLNNAIKYNILLQACICVPFIFECNYILSLWLVSVPPFAVVFCQIMLVTTILRTTCMILNIAIQATGKIRQLSFISGSISLIQLPIIYVILKFGGGPEWCYLMSIIGLIVVVLIDVEILKHNIKNMQIIDTLKPYFEATLISLVFSIFPFILVKHMEESFLRLISSFICYSLPLSLFTYHFVIDKETKTILRNYIKNKIVGIKFSIH